jgi:Cu/Ag efflux protein CusF
MNTNRALTIAVLLFLSASAASAATAIGRITLIDPNTRQLMLDSNYIYTVSPKFDLSSVAVGDQVRLNWESQGGKQVVTSITKTPPKPSSSQ